MRGNEGKSVVASLGARVLARHDPGRALGAAVRERRRPKRVDSAMRLARTRMVSRAWTALAVRAPEPVPAAPVAATPASPLSSVFGLSGAGASWLAGDDPAGSGGFTTLPGGMNPDDFLPGGVASSGDPIEGALKREEQRQLQRERMKGPVRRGMVVEGADALSRSTVAGTPVKAQPAEAGGDAPAASSAPASPTARASSSAPASSSALASSSAPASSSVPASSTTPAAASSPASSSPASRGRATTTARTPGDADPAPARPRRLARARSEASDALPRPTGSTPAGAADPAPAVQRRRLARAPRTASTGADPGSSTAAGDESATSPQRLHRGVAHPEAEVPTEDTTDAAPAVEPLRRVDRSAGGASSPAAEPAVPEAGDAPAPVADRATTVASASTGRVDLAPRTEALDRPVEPQRASEPQRVDTATTEAAAPELPAKAQRLTRARRDAPPAPAAPAEPQRLDRATSETPTSASRRVDRSTSDGTPAKPSREPQQVARATTEPSTSAPDGPAQPRRVDRTWIDAPPVSRPVDRATSDADAPAEPVRDERASTSAPAESVATGGASTPVTDGPATPQRVDRATSAASTPAADGPATPQRVDRAPASRPAEPQRSEGGTPALGDGVGHGSARPVEGFSQRVDRSATGNEAAAEPERAEPVPSRADSIAPTQPLQLVERAATAADDSHGSAPAGQRVDRVQDAGAPAEAPSTEESPRAAEAAQPLRGLSRVPASGRRDDTRPAGPPARVSEAQTRRADRTPAPAHAVPATAPDESVRTAAKPPSRSTSSTDAAHSARKVARARKGEAAEPGTASVEGRAPGAGHQHPDRSAPGYVAADQPAGDRGAGPAPLRRVDRATEAAPSVGQEDDGATSTAGQVAPGPTRRVDRAPTRTEVAEPTTDRVAPVDDGSTPRAEAPLRRVDRATTSADVTAPPVERPSRGDRQAEPEGPVPVRRVDRVTTDGDLTSHPGQPSGDDGRAASEGPASPRRVDRATTAGDVTTPPAVRPSSHDGQAESPAPLRRVDRGTTAGDVTAPPALRPSGDAAPEGPAPVRRVDGATTAADVMAPPVGQPSSDDGQVESPAPLRRVDRGTTAGDVRTPPAARPSGGDGEANPEAPAPVRRVDRAVTADDITVGPVDQASGDDDETASKAPAPVRRVDRGTTEDAPVVLAEDDRVAPASPRRVDRPRTDEDVASATSVAEDVLVGEDAAPSPRRIDRTKAGGTSEYEQPHQPQRAATGGPTPEGLTARRVDRAPSGATASPAQATDRGPAGAAAPIVRPEQRLARASSGGDVTAVERPAGQRLRRAGRPKPADDAADRRLDRSPADGGQTGEDDTAAAEPAVPVRRVDREPATEDAAAGAVLRRTDRAPATEDAHRGADGAPATEDARQRLDRAPATEDAAPAAAARPALRPADRAPATEDALRRIDRSPATDRAAAPVLRGVDRAPATEAAPRFADRAPDLGDAGPAAPPPLLARAFDDAAPSVRVARVPRQDTAVTTPDRPSQPVRRIHRAASPQARRPHHAHVTETTSMPRLARRTRSRTAAAPEHPPTAPTAASAQALADATGGSLSHAGGRATIEFPVPSSAPGANILSRFVATPPSTSTSAAPAAAPQAASAPPPAIPPSRNDAADLFPPAPEPRSEAALATGSRRSALELERLYEDILERLRRDLVSERERVGHLIGTTGWGV